MSIELEYSRPQGTEVKSTMGVVYISNSGFCVDIEMVDFCEMVRYVFENTDLEPDDPRLQVMQLLSEDIQTAGEVTGWGGKHTTGSKRLELGWRKKHILEALAKSQDRKANK